jgi:hypothetical protein
MAFDILGFDDDHLAGEYATHPPVPRSPRHAALLVLAGMSLPRPRASPGTPITALASAFNYRFQDNKMMQSASDHQGIFPMRRLLPLLLLAALPVWAQQPQPPQPAVPPPPPGMEILDDELMAMDKATIVPGEHETREEHRINGKLYMVKVTPDVGKPYYLIDRQGDGVFVEMDIESSRPVRPPMWILHSW